MAFFEFHVNGYILRIKAVPNASCCSCKGIICDAKGNQYLKVMVNAVPEKGKANKELLVWLAKILKVSKSSLSIISGESDHSKKVFLQSAQNSEIDEKLNNLAQRISK